MSFSLEKVLEDGDSLGLALRVPISWLILFASLGKCLTMKQPSNFMFVPVNMSCVFKNGLSSMAQTSNDNLLYDLCQLFSKILIWFLFKCYIRFALGRRALG